MLLDDIVLHAFISILQLFWCWWWWWWLWWLFNKVPFNIRNDWSIDVSIINALQSNAVPPSVRWYVCAQSDGRTENSVQWQQITKRQPTNISHNHRILCENSPYTHNGGNVSLVFMALGLPPFKFYSSSLFSQINATCRNFYISLWLSKKIKKKLIFYRKGGNCNTYTWRNGKQYKNCS